MFSILRNYFFLNYFVLLFQTFIFFKMAQCPDLWTMLFCLIVYITYPVFYLLFIFVPVFLLALLLWKAQWNHCIPKGILYFIATAGCAFIQILLITDVYIFKMFGFHFNGFVLNMVLTKGGIGALGSDDSTYFSVAMIVAGFFSLQILLLCLTLYVKKVQLFFQRLFCKRIAIAMVVFFLFFSLSERVAYAASSFFAYMPVLEASNSFPFYIPLHMSSIFKKLGFKSKGGRAFKIKIGDINLRYPIAPLQRKANQKNYNIVWLIAESLRSDMLAPSTMPETWKFTQKSLFFQNHYSGGNFTRTGVFTMFYGLHGTYWFPIFHAKRSPVLMDFLQKEGYHIEIFSSQSFSYPEFDQTIFVNIPPSQMHQSKLSPGWKRDREHVDNILKFLKNRDKQKPFMFFMFYDSTHSCYSFPPECAIKKPYLLDFNYVTTDLKRDMQLLKNSYINAVYHLDSQIARIIHYLEQNRMLEDTIVIITGDHGQEFMEKGRWGHHSSFSEEQTRSPLVLWIPGEKEKTIQRLSCHQDIPPTLLKYLGVINPIKEYCLGSDLLEDKQQANFVILSDWAKWCYVDQEYKAIFPMDSKKFWEQKVMDLNDQEVPSSQDFYQKNQTRLIQIMKDLTLFTTFSQKK